MQSNHNTIPASLQHCIASILLLLSKETAFLFTLCILLYHCMTLYQIACPSIRMQDSVSDVTHIKTNLYKNA